VRALGDKDHRLLLQEGENQMALQELLVNDTALTEEKKEDNDYAMQPTTTSPMGNGTRSTLLIATGRGKVRAGIFSRHHLLTAGIEMGTSWHCIREARMRKWASQSSIQTRGEKRWGTRASGGASASCSTSMMAMRLRVQHHRLNHRAHS